MNGIKNGSTTKQEDRSNIMENLDFFKRWFHDFGDGINNLNEEECGRLFQPCASQCAKDALKYLYQDLFSECEGNPDTFFERLHEVNGVDGKVIEPGNVYELIFLLECSCPIHSQAGVNTVKLCECSRQSILCELKTLMPKQRFQVEKKTSILDGDPCCCFRITRVD